MSDSRKGLLGLLALVFLFFIFFFAFAIFAVKKVSQDQGGDFFEASSDQDLIAVVEVKGVIMDARKVVESLMRAEKKEEVKAIIVRVESPGGAVGPSQEIYEEISRIDKEKPVFASLGTVAASGGYYIASASRKIYSNPGTLTGSIGVIMQMMNLSELFKFLKVEPQIIKAGKYKDIGAPNHKMTVKEKELIKDVVENTHEQFIRDILKKRQGKIIGDIHDHAQGQFFSGETALKMGLVDELKGLWEAGRSIFTDLGLKGEFKLVFVKEKKKRFSIGDFVDYMEGVHSFFDRALGQASEATLYYK